MKTLIVSGDLTKGLLKYRPIGREFQSNNWYLKLNSVALKSSVVFDEAITITCNFSTNQNYSSNTIVNYEQPMQMFYVKLAVNGKSVNRFVDETWFHVNSSSSELLFSFRDMEGRKIKKATLSSCLMFTIDQR